MPPETSPPSSPPAPAVARRTAATPTAARLPRGGSGEMFDRIAARYDLLNRVLSLGIDRRWRRRAVAALALAPGDRVLDVATGTADVALEVLRQQPAAGVVGLDPSAEMLRAGDEKVRAAGLADRVELRQGDVQDLPWDTASFDAAVVAFGIRNVPDRVRGLAEMRRVVRPGGRVAVLELAEPEGGLLAPFARFYIHTVVPRLGALLSGAPEYRYLERSIATFPPRRDFAAQMAAAGLAAVEIRPLTLGVVTLFVGRTPGPAPPEATS